MNKSKTCYGMSMLLSFLCLTLNSCKKDSSPKLTDEEQIQLAKIWYEKTQTGLSSTIRTSSGKIAKLIFKPEWDTAKFEYFENSPSITLSVETNLEKLGTTVTHYNLVITKHENDYTGKTISVSSLKSGVDKQLTAEQLYAAAFSKTDNLAQIKDLNADVRVYNSHFAAEKHIMYSGTEKISMKIQKPQLFQSVSEKGLGDIKMPDKSMVRTCTNYYLNVKEYNYSGTLINETNTFLYQNCYGVDDGENTEIDWIENDMPGGGVTDEEEIVTVNWGSTTSIDNGFTTESSGSKIVKWYFYTVPNTNFRYKSYEKIELETIPLGLNKQNISSINHLNITTEGTIVDQRSECILNYSSGTIYFWQYLNGHSYNAADMTLSFADKRSFTKNGRQYERVSEDMGAWKSWNPRDLGLVN